MAKKEWVAEAKAALAAEGHSLHPHADVKVFEKLTGPGAVVVVERVVAGFTPDYCIHGYASCVACNAMCYLGSGTVDACHSGKAYAMCLQCASTLIPQSEGVLIDRLDDHRRADGPH